ncbi:ankyrin repeat-containing domain protein [Hyaloscypha sp. PMI_1271]|nr:ankyrin repeat-containing domain protein [Hyaloscypha sp. PMI_1271]
MAVDWALYEEDVIRLYVNENKTVNETLECLHEKYGVKVRQQFKSKFGGLKNLRANEWKVVIKEIRKRKAEGKGSYVYLNGRKLDPGRVNREMRRYSGDCNTEELVEKDTSIGLPPSIYKYNLDLKFVAHNALDIAIDSHTQNRIEIRTPSPSTIQSPMINGSLARHILPEELSIQQSHTVGPQMEFTDGPLFLDPGPDLDAMDFDAMDFDAWISISILLEWMINPFASVLPNFQLAALKPAAYFIEQVLWALSPGCGDPDGDFDSFSQQSLHQIFSIIAYLASNSMLRHDQMLRFLKWVFRSGLENQLSFIMHASSTSLRACIEAVLEEVMKLWIEFPLGVQHILNLFISADNLDLLNRLGGKLLHFAARNSNLDAAKLLVAYGADVNFVGPLSLGPSKLGTPLCAAILSANITMVQYLISAGSDINKQFGAKSSQKVETALTIAIGGAKFNAAKILLDSGAEVNMDLKIEGHNILEFAKAKLPKIYPVLLERLGPEHTPQVYQMIDAAEKGNRALSRFLLKHNIVQEEILEHALCHAIRMQNVGAVRTLLHRGIDPDARRSRLVHNAITGPNALEDNLPIFLAAACSDEDISDDIMYLLWKAGANLNDDILTRMCRLAAVEDQPERLWILAELGLNPALLGPSVLEYIALGAGGIYTSGSFLDKGTPINLYGLRGLNSLQAAAKKGNLLLTQYLLDRGADINLLPRVDRGLTALQAAALGGFTEIIEYLIDAGADVKAPPAKKGGVTVLEAAAGASSGHNDYWEDRDLDQERKLVSIFKNLLALGAPVNRTDGSSSNVLHQLIRSSRNECLKLAIQAGAHIEAREASRGMMTPLQVAAEANIEAIQLLLDHGAEINAPPGDEFGRTALQAATSANPDRRIVEFLYSRGADVNAGPARKGGVTALQGVAIRGDIPIARMLLNYGADVNAAPALEEGRTAVEGAAEHGRLDMVRLLLSLGAKADPVVRFSRAIRLAEENDHFVLADLLREHENVSHFLLAEPDSSLFGLST